MYNQLIQPNLSVVGTVGDCLAYAREMFSAPGGVEWAWQAWENAQYKHTDQNFPANCDVPMWYSYNGTEGHVTVNVSGRGIYSSPWQEGTTNAVLQSVADVERIYGVTYVGWSEDINGVRVCEPVPAATLSATPSPAPAANTGLVDHTGTATVTVGPINVRTAPSTTAPIVAQYGVDQTFNYDSYIITDGYVWLSYMSVSGTRHYVAEGPNDGNEANVWVSGGI